MSTDGSRAASGKPSFERRYARWAKNTSSTKCSATSTM